MWREQEGKERGVHACVKRIQHSLKGCVTVYAYQVSCKACWGGGGSTFSPVPPPPLPLPPLPPPRPQKSCFPHPTESRRRPQSSAGAGSLRGPWPGQEAGYDISGQKAGYVITHHMHKLMNGKQDLQVTESRLMWWIHQRKATTGSDSAWNVIFQLSVQDFLTCHHLLKGQRSQSVITAALKQIDYHIAWGYVNRADDCSYRSSNANWHSHRRTHTNTHTQTHTLTPDTIPLQTGLS